MNLFQWAKAWESYTQYLWWCFYRSYHVDTGKKGFYNEEIFRWEDSPICVPEGSVIRDVRVLLYNLRRKGCVGGYRCLCLKVRFKAYYDKETLYLELDRGLWNDQGIDKMSKSW
jgi:hypothetical protein